MSTKTPLPKQEIGKRGDVGDGVGYVGSPEHFAEALQKGWERRVVHRSRFRNAKISADLPGKETVDFGMARHRGPSVVGGVTPPGMVAAFTHKDTTMRGEMAYQLTAFHTCSKASS